MTGRSRAVVVAMMLWWAFFGCVSVSWALGSPWLVDTVLQGEGLRLAQERPTWFVVVVLVSGLVKLGFVIFGLASCVRTSSGCRAGCAWPSAGSREPCSSPTGWSARCRRSRQSCRGNRSPVMAGGGWFCGCLTSGRVGSWCWPRRSYIFAGAVPAVSSRGGFEAPASTWDRRRLAQDGSFCPRRFDKEVLRLEATAFTRCWPTCAVRRGSRRGMRRGGAGMCPSN